MKTRSLFIMLSSMSLGASSLVVGVIAFIGAADAISSAFLSRPIEAVQELSETLLPVTFFLALPFAQAAKSHVSIDVLYVHMPNALKRLGFYLDKLVTVFVLVALTYAIWSYALASLEARELASAAYQFPIYPAKIASAVGMSLAVLIEIIMLFQADDE